ncbi:hypothetical protein [Streptomyces sp. NPDC047985]|uniref:hypothetical protein n=1 Tax=unclassified Streptomyces TaxID=2593676 RepID=UPI00342C6734
MQPQANGSVCFLEAESNGCCPRCGGDEHVQLESMTPEHAFAFVRFLASAAQLSPK